MPFADEFRRCMKLPRERDVVETFVITSINVSVQNLLEGVYEFPVKIVVTGTGGKKEVLKAFKPVFSKVISLFTQYGSLYQCRGGKLEVEGLGPKTFKITTTGIGCRVYPRQELEAFLQYIKEITNMGDMLNTEQIIASYLEYYKKKVHC